MSSYQVLDTTDTAYTFYEIEKRKEIKKNKEDKSKEKKKKRKREKIEETNCRAPPPQAMWQTLENSKLGKKEKKKNTTTCNQSKTKNQGKKQRENNRQTKAQSTLQVAAAVCGTSSIAKFSLVVRLVPCYPDCRLRPAFVNYAQPLGVRQYETSKAGSSSTHAT